MTMDAEVAAAFDALRERPFSLDDGQIDWISRQFHQLTDEQKLAQLFNVMVDGSSKEQVDHLRCLGLGGITVAPWAPLEAALGIVAQLSSTDSLRPVFSADLEGGAISPPYMTPLTNQLGMAAIVDPTIYREAVGVLAEEGRALGIDWTFSPVIDINADFRSAIVATRSFGSDVETIGRLAVDNVRTFQGHGLAATAKHWPGEGYDSRDQHLVTTVNPLPMNDWRATFGKLYQTMIAEGVMSIMTAHIALPAYAHECGISGLEAYRPASISQLLNLQLLRGEMGFNGLITSDATTMGGLTSWGPRNQVLPEVIENGADMVLFSPDIDGDLEIMANALEKGALSRSRMDCAVLRVLGLKAALGIHLEGSPRQLASEHVASALKNPQSLAVSEDCASRSPTLVKDVQGMLPLSPDRTRRILILEEDGRLGFGDSPPEPLLLGELLSSEGFEVLKRNPGDPAFPGEPDLVMYVLAQESLLTKSHIFLRWAEIQGSFERAMERSWHSVQTMLISFGQPYYLFDAPRLPCLINAYSAVEPVQRAVVRKLLGREEFTGRNPVDPFCGLADAQY